MPAAPRDAAHARALLSGGRPDIPWGHALVCEVLPWWMAQ
jgi:hypothetical protein